MATSSTAYGSACNSTSVKAWITTLDQTSLLEELPGIVFECSSLATNESQDDPGYAHIRVNRTRRFQAIRGFGAALTGASGFVIHRIPQALREPLLHRLFAPMPAGGIGLNLLRLSIGASDFSVSYQPGNVTYDDTEGDMQLKHFSTSSEDSFVVPTLRRILSISQHMTLMATPWTAPLWMKTVQSLGGGRLKHSDEAIDLYARYLVRYLSEFAARGIHIDYLTLQNEPGHGSCNGMPCMTLDPVSANRLALRVAWHIRSSSCRGTKLLAYDHNWNANFQQQLSIILESCESFAPIWLIILLFGFSLGRTLGYASNKLPASPNSSPSSRSVRTPSADLTSPTSNTLGRNLSDPGFYGRVSLEEPLLQMGAPSRSIEARPAASKVWMQHLPKLINRFLQMVLSVQFLWAATILLLVLRMAASTTLFVLGHYYGRFTANIGENYPVQMLEMSGGFLFAGVAWHCYGGSPQAMQHVADRFKSWDPPLEQHLTECSGGAWQGSWATSLVQDQKNLFIGGAQNSGQSVIRWNLALDESGGPRCTGHSCCVGCRGVVTVPSDATSMANITFNVEFYGLAHHSAFVTPGARRVFSQVLPSQSTDVHAVAYENQDGRLVLVVLNENSKANASLRIEEVGDSLQNCSFQFVLPPGVVTFTWPRLFSDMRRKAAA